MSYSIRKYSKDFILYHSYGDFMIQEFQGSLYDDPNQPMELPLISIKRENLESVVKKLASYACIEPQHANVNELKNFGMFPAYLEAPFDCYNLLVDDLARSVKKSYDRWLDGRRKKIMLFQNIDEKEMNDILREQIDQVSANFSEIIEQVEKRILYEIWTPLQLERSIANAEIDEDELEKAKNEINF